MTAAVKIMACALCGIEGGLGLAGRLRQQLQLVLDALCNAQEVADAAVPVVLPTLAKLESKLGREDAKHWLDTVGNEVRLIRHDGGRERTGIKKLMQAVDTGLNEGEFVFVVETQMPPVPPPGTEPWLPLEVVLANKREGGLLVIGRGDTHRTKIHEGTCGVVIQLSGLLGGKPTGVLPAAQGNLTNVERLAEALGDSTRAPYVAEHGILLKPRPLVALAVA